jgi:hypothetical protein
MKLKISVVIILVILSIYSVNRSFKGYYNSCYEQGRKAYKEGVPATANPMIGRGEGNYWLDGWLEEKSNEKNQRSQ